MSPDTWGSAQEHDTGIGSVWVKTFCTARSMSPSSNGLGSVHRAPNFLVNSSEVKPNDPVYPDMVMNLRVGKSWTSSRIMVIPLFSGITRSQIIKSAGRDRKSSTPSAPLTDSRTVWPADSRASRKNPRICRSSSMMRIVAMYQLVISIGHFRP